MAKGPAPAKPNRHRLVCQCNPRQECCGNDSHGPPRLCVAVTLWCRCHLSFLQPKPFGQLIGQVKGCGGVVLDRDTHHAKLLGVGKQPHDFEPRDTKFVAYFLLTEIANVIQPCHLCHAVVTMVFDKI